MSGVGVSTPQLTFTWHPHEHGNLCWSIAAFIVQQQGVKNNNLLAFTGLLAIIFSIFFYDETTPFPSVYALVPVLVLCRVVADKYTFAAELFSTKGFVGIGLVSYLHIFGISHYSLLLKLEYLNLQTRSLLP